MPSATTQVEGLDTALPTAPVVVIHGHAAPEQVCAIIAVLSALSGGEGGGEPLRSSLWADHGRAVRTTSTRGPGAWRASSQPR